MRRDYPLKYAKETVQKDEHGRLVSYHLQIDFAWEKILPFEKKERVIPKERKERKIKEKNEKSEKNIIPPKLEWIREYCKLRHNNVNPKTFFDFYASKGWMIGKNHMKDWQAAVRTWEQKDEQASNGNGHKPPIFDDGIKYVWNPKRDCYVHSVSGTLYIP